MTNYRWHGVFTKSKMSAETLAEFYRTLGYKVRIKPDKPTGIQKLMSKRKIYKLLFDW